MVDYFALLEEPRRPWLDADSLKQKFLALSAALHPDKMHNEPPETREKAQRRYAELNSAHACLQEPRDRLRHLLELERGPQSEDVQQVPPELSDVFFEIGALCRAADAFLAEKSRATSPMLQAQLFQRGQEWLEKIEPLEARVKSKRDAVMDELKKLDAEWDARNTESLDRLQGIYRQLGFFDRWAAQLSSRKFKMLL